MTSLDRFAEQHPLEEHDRFGQPLTDRDEPPLGLAFRPALDRDRHEPLVELSERKHGERTRCRPLRATPGNRWRENSSAADRRV